MDYFGTGLELADFIQQVHFVGSKMAQLAQVAITVAEFYWQDDSMKANQYLG